MPWSRALRVWSATTAVLVGVPLIVPFAASAAGYVGPRPSNNRPLDRYHYEGGTIVFHFQQNAVPPGEQKALIQNVRYRLQPTPKRLVVPWRTFELQVPDGMDPDSEQLFSGSSLNLAGQTIRVRYLNVTDMHYYCANSVVAGDVAVPTPGDLNATCDGELGW